MPDGDTAVAVRSGAGRVMFWLARTTYGQQAILLAIAVVVGCCGVIPRSTNAQESPTSDKSSPPSSVAAGNVPQEETITNTIGMKLRLIPAGRFKMGSELSYEELERKFGTASILDNEHPLHEVEITRPYYLGLYEVTKGQFRQFVEATGYKTDSERDGKGCAGYTPANTEISLQGPPPHFSVSPKFSWADWGVKQSDDSPVVNVSWNDAVAFCTWLSAKERKTYRLPTEAEWEYACRAGTTTLYSWGDDIQQLTKYANVKDTSAKKLLTSWFNFKVTTDDGYAFTAPVGRFRPNPFGLYDMHGNVSEWCSDWYSYGENYYAVSPTKDPPGPPVGKYCVRRGGNWSGSPEGSRSACRSSTAPGESSTFCGFRVACEVAPAATASMVATASPPDTAAPTPAPAEPTAASPEETITNSIGMKLRLIPAGEFLMGSPESEEKRWLGEQQHRVKLTYSFYMGVYEVTQDEYKRIMGKNPSWYSSSGAGYSRVQGVSTDRFPVEQVSWADATAFCAELSRKERQRYRLPTEAEWEYACRAGTTSAFHFGNELNGQQANCDGNEPYGTSEQGPYLARATTVGSYAANAFGLFDMHGNLSEWCRDWHDVDYYTQSPKQDPGGPATGDLRIHRGGGFYSFAVECRSANRGGMSPTLRSLTIGFRVAREVDSALATNVGKPSEPAPTAKDLPPVAPDSTDTAVSSQPSVAPLPVGVSGGSGMVVHADGYVLTHLDVIEPPSWRFKIEDSALEVVVGEKSYAAQVASVDRSLGLALLRIEARGLPTASLSQDAALIAEQDVYSVGWPLNWNLDAAPLDAHGKIFFEEKSGGEPVAKIPTAMNPGQQGGPCLNQRGEVVGLISSTTERVCIPAHNLRRFLETAKVDLSRTPAEADLGDEELLSRVRPTLAYVRHVVKQATWKVPLENPATAFTPLGFVRGGEALLTEGDHRDYRLRLWDVRTGELLHTFGTKEGPFRRVALGPLLDEFVASDDTGNVYLMSLRDWKKVVRWQAFTPGETPPLNAAAARPDNAELDMLGISLYGETILTGRGSKIKIWSRTHELKSSWELPSQDNDLFTTPPFALSPDGKRLALWDFKKRRGLLLNVMGGTQLDTIPLTLGRQPEFSTDGRLLFTGLGSIWDFSHRRELSMRAQPGFANTRLAMFGTQLVGAGTVSKDQWLDLWQPIARLRLTRLTAKGAANQTGLYDAQPVISPNGSLVATAEDDGVIRLWFLQPQLTGLPNRTVLSGHGATAELGEQRFQGIIHTTTAAFTRGGTLVASSASDRAGDSLQERLVLADRQTGKVRWSRLIPEHLHHLGISANEERIVAAPARNDAGVRVTLYDTTNGEVVREVPLTEPILVSVAISADGQFLATTTNRPETGPDGKVQQHLAIQRWNVTTGEKLPDLKSTTAAGDVPMQACFAPDGRTLAAITERRELKLWDLTTGDLLRAFAPEEMSGQLSSDAPTFSPDGQRLAAAGEGVVVIWDVASGRQLAACRHASEPPLRWHTPRFSRDGEYLAAVADAWEQSFVAVWHAQTGELAAISDLASAGFVCRDLDFSSEAGVLDVVNEDLVVRHWRWERAPRPDLVHEALLARGQQRLLAKDFAAAQADFERILSDEPFDRTATLQRCRALIGQRTIADVRPILETLIEQEPDDVDARLVYAELLEVANDSVGVLAEMNSLIERVPTNPFFYLMRGKVHAGQKEEWLAIFDYTSALRLIPLPEARRERAASYGRVGRWSSALADLKELEKLSQGDALAKVQASIREAEAALATAAPLTETAPLPAGYLDPAEPVAPDTCVIKLTAPEGAMVTVDGRDYGTKRSFTFTGLKPEQKLATLLKIKFTAGGEAVRTVPLVAGRTMYTSAAVPSQIVFQGWSETSEGVYRILPDGTQEKYLGNSGYIGDTARVSPDGSRIASTDFGESLTLIASDGSEMRPLLEGVQKHDVYDRGRAFDWMPDSRHLIVAFPSKQVDQVDVETGERRQVAEGDFPTVSPDGRWLITTLDAESPTGGTLALWPIEGGNAHMLTQGMCAQWSPDGQKIAFYRSRSVRRYDRDLFDHDLYVKRTDGSDLRMLSQVVEDFRWSPDSRQVAMFGFGFGDRELHLVEADGRRPRTLRITDARMSRRNWPHALGWSPDGKQVLFAREYMDLKIEDEEWEVMSINADGTGLRKIVPWQGDYWSVDWR